MKGVRVHLEAKASSHSRHCMIYGFHHVFFFKGMFMFNSWNVCGYYVEWMCLMVLEPLVIMVAQREVLLQKYVERVEGK